MDIPQRNHNKRREFRANFIIRENIYYLMKYSGFSKLVTFAIFVLLILGTSIGTRNIYADVNLADVSNLNLSLHSPISVYSDQDLLELGFPGNGTQNSPIIIENLVIVSESGSSLLINNVSLNFIVRNCYLEAFHTALGLTEIISNYVEIYNNTIVDTLYGISARDCVQINISSNLINSCKDGVYARNITDLKVRNNTVIDFESYGITIFDCYNITVEENVCETTDSSLFLAGISIYDNNCTTLVRNNCTNCDYYIGLDVYVTDFTYNITDNIVNSNKLGFYFNASNIDVDIAKYGQFLLQYCDNVTIKNQYISNVNIGIEILECNNISIVENYFYEINMFDCYILLSTNVNFSSNICEEGSTGVFVRLNENCTINSNVFLEIDKGISFSDTMSTTVIDNSFTNSSFSFDLLSQDAFSELIFHNNTINNKPFGFFKDETNLIISNSDFSQILLSNCSNVEITNQTLSYVWNTIYITDCAEINVHDSNFNKNHDVLLFLRSSLIEIKNCEFNYNSVPIILIDSYVIEISQNNFFNNENTAIIGFFSSSLQIRLNLIHNSSTGICFFATDYGTITFNTIQYCRDYGIELLYDSAYNKIYSNNFIENYLTHSGSQAYDEGYHNDWYDGVNYKGNYWSNWNPLENYYRIDGSAESKDIYPNSMLMGEYSSALLYSIFLPIVLIIINRRKKKKNRR